MKTMQDLCKCVTHTVKMLMNNSEDKDINMSL